MKDGPRRQVIEICRRLYGRGLIAGLDGNVSVKAGGGFWITPAGSHKGMVKESQLLLVDEDGSVQQGVGRPSSEWRIHAAIYTAAPECGAVLHAHPPWTLALSLSGLPMRPFLLSEAEIFLSELATVPYYSPGTPELAGAVASVCVRSRIVVLERHGVVAWGKGPEEAFNLIECLEHVSKVTLLARGLGARKPDGAIPG